MSDNAALHSAGYNTELRSKARELRKNMTAYERELWYRFLKYYPVPFKRQRIIGYYIADFYCTKASLAVELDGSQHYSEEGLKKDKIRTLEINEYGIEVLRITNYEVFKDFDYVRFLIDYYVKKRMEDKNTAIP